LTELVTILECSKLQGRLFLPIFYDVDPSHIRNITGTYAEAFAKHEVRFGDEKDKVQKWRDALHQAASVSGWHFKPGYALHIILLYSSFFNYPFLYFVSNTGCNCNLSINSIMLNMIHIHL
jgi:uncharacterized protein (DUF2249 family)